MDLSNLRLRYLIGADNATGEDGAFTVVSYDATQPTSQGVSAKYCNLFDEKNRGEYGPYLTTSDTAQQYAEGQCDPAGAGFWKNVSDQIKRAKDQGFTILGDIDNRDSYRNADVLKVYNQAALSGLKIICKNPGMSDFGEDSTELVKHPAVIGCIIEQGDMTPAHAVIMRTAAGRPELPVWFVSFGDGRTWADQTAAQIKGANYVNMGVTYSSQGEYGSSEDVLVPLTDQTITTQPLTLGQKVKAVMLARGYPWFPDQNVVSIEGMNPDGSPNANRHNAFDDIKMVLDGDGNTIGGPWAGTTHPGTYWTVHPMASGGAFIIALGPQSCWTPGDYHSLTVWRQAEDSTIMGHRDPNDTYVRQGPPVQHGNIGVHHHGGYNLPKDNISNAAAGCQVIEMTADQAAFMNLTMQCPRYLADKHGYRLTATVLEAKDLLEAGGLPAPTSTPLPQPVVMAPASNDFTHCLKLLLVHEGGNDDDPRDPGGRTSRGITQTEWTEWRKMHPGLPSDVWQAPDDQVAAIYRAEYWDLMLCDGLPSGIDYAVFDYGVNSGPSRAVKALQGAIGVTVDGHVGRVTIAAAAAADAHTVIGAVCDQRLAFLRGLSTWGTFGHGWAARVSDVRRDALAMVGTPIPAPSPAPMPAPLPPPPLPTQPVPLPKPKEPPVVTEPLPLPPPPPPTATLTAEQKQQLVDTLSPVIAATVKEAVQKLAQSPKAASIFSSLMTKLFSAVPQLSVVAYVALNALQALGHVGTATGDTATATGVIATSGIIGTGVLGLLSKLGKIGGLLALIPKP